LPSRPTIGTITRQTWYFRVIATNAVWQSPPSGVATVGGAALAAAVAAPAAIAAPVPQVTDVTIASAVTRAALTGAGVRMAVTVPAGARVLRLRVLTTSGAALRQVHRVKAAPKAHRIRLRLHSRRLGRTMRSGRWYVLELTPGSSSKQLGQPTHRRFRLR